MIFGDIQPFLFSDHALLFFLDWKTGRYERNNATMSTHEYKATAVPNCFWPPSLIPMVHFFFPAVSEVGLINSGSPITTSMPLGSPTELHDLRATTHSVRERRNYEGVFFIQYVWREMKSDVSSILWLGSC